MTQPSILGVAIGIFTGINGAFAIDYFKAYGFSAIAFLVSSIILAFLVLIAYERYQFIRTLATVAKNPKVIEAFATMSALLAMRLSKKKLKLSTQSSGDSILAP